MLLLLSAVRNPPSSYTKSHGNIILHSYCANAIFAYRALIFKIELFDLCIS